MAIFLVSSMEEAQRTLPNNPCLETPTRGEEREAGENKEERGVEEMEDRELEWENRC